MMFFQELINHPLMASVAFSSGLLFVLAFRSGPTSFLPSLPPKARFARVQVRSNHKSKSRRSVIR